MFLGIGCDANMEVSNEGQLDRRFAHEIRYNCFLRVGSIVGYRADCRMQLGYRADFACKKTSDVGVPPQRTPLSTFA